MADAKPPVDWDTLGFDVVATDVMYIAEVKAGADWTRGELRPFGNVSMSPAASVLNYGAGIFEGMKAQRTESGGVVLFRPKCNASRMARGAERMSLAPVPEDIFLHAVESVVAGNERWIPPYGKGALYIRPCLYGSGATLALTPASSFTFLVYACPVGAYFKGGMSPISLLVSDDYHRAAPGGQGGVKAIGNYAPGMLPSMAAKKEKFNEILYLDSTEHKFIEEVGAANFFCIKDSIVHTPPLSGTILPGVTRASVIQLAKDMGLEVREEKVPISFALGADEAFCTGTAAVISPIGKIQHGSQCVEFCGGKVGRYTQELFNTLTGIQLCQVPDLHGWVSHVTIGKD